MSGGYRTLSQHVDDLKKENFNLKLRIYFLEERIQHKTEDADVYNTNVKLRVEVESLKKDVQEKQQLLAEAWSAAENSSKCKEPPLHDECRQRLEDAEHIQRLLENKIQILQENLVEKQSRDANQYGALLEKQVSMLQDAEQEIQALKDKLQESQDTIEMLQDAQRQLTATKNNVQEIAQDQERMLQCLKETLQSKDREVGELYQIIGNHEDTIAKLQDMLLKSQNEHLQFFQVMPTQLDFLDLQNTLLLTQMELQKKQMALLQKEHQLSDAKRFQQLLEVQLLEGKQQKETTWNHNQELHRALRKLQKEVQDKNQYLKHVEEEKCTKLAAQEQNIHKLKETVSKKEQMLQEYMDVLSYKQSLREIPSGNEHTLEKLRQRIRERDTALELAIESKFFALEDKENEVNQLKRIIREREQDIERLTNILSGNEETINSLDNLVKAKDMELDQISAAYKDLQWLKQETEEKYRCSLSEKESVILQMQKSLQDKEKESEELTTCFLAQSDSGNAEVIEELTKCLQRKEQMLQGAVLARKQQAEEHMKEMMEMLTTSFTQSPSASTPPIYIKNLDTTESENERTENLRTDLDRAQEDLRIVLRKMREYQLEVSALQSIIMKQNEQLRDQAADIVSCSRNIQMKEDLIKNLQTNAADKGDKAAAELHNQHSISPNEKTSSMCGIYHENLPHTHKVSSLCKLLEELIGNKTRLSEVLRTEKQIYSCLMKCHTDCDSVSLSSKILHELLAVHSLRSQLEDTLMRVIEQLVALQSDHMFVSGFGDPREEGNNEKIFHQRPEDEDPPRTPTQRVTERLMIGREEVSEKLPYELRDGETIPSKMRKVTQEMCIQNGNVKVAEESEVSEHWEYQTHRKVREDSAGDSESMTEGRKKTEIPNLSKQKEYLLNSAGTAAHGDQKYFSHSGGQPRADSVRRGRHVSGSRGDEGNQDLQGRSHQPTDDVAHKYNLHFNDENCELEDMSNSSEDAADDAFLPDEIPMKSDNRHMQMDFQDQGYETCGKSENEMDRETTSPDYDEDDDLFTEDNTWSHEETSSPPGKNPQSSRDAERSEDVVVLKQLVKTLSSQLEKAQNVIQALQTQRSPSCGLPDGGWWSDSAGRGPPGGLGPLAQRVSVLETQLYQLQKYIGSHCQTSLSQEAGPYEWLIQEQARELSSMRQRMQEGETICHILTQHQEENIKSVEEMLQANDIDYSTGRNFRKRLIHVRRLAEKLKTTLRSDVCCHSSSSDTEPYCDSLNDALTAESRYYAIGHSEDFHTLEKHVMDGKSMAEEIEKCLHRESQRGKGVECGAIQKLIATTGILKNILHDSISLLRTFWTENLPNTQISQRKEEAARMKDEILTLRRKVKEKDVTIRRISEKLRTSSLAQSSMERLISRQLTSTCGILRKARSNLKT